jgi:hypothetical protein
MELHFVDVGEVFVLSELVVAPILNPVFFEKQAFEESLRKAALFGGVVVVGVLIKVSLSCDMKLLNS